MSDNNNKDQPTKPEEGKQGDKPEAPAKEEKKK